MDIPQAHLVESSNWGGASIRTPPEPPEPPEPPKLGFTARISNMYLSQEVGQPLFLTDVTFLLKGGGTRQAHRLQPLLQGKVQWLLGGPKGPGDRHDGY